MQKVCHKTLLTVFTEAPEEKYDPRSLYDRLQEQKQKKQDEYEAQFSLSEFHLLHIQ